MIIHICQCIHFRFSAHILIGNFLTVNGTETSCNTIYFLSVFCCTDKEKPKPYTLFSRFAKTHIHCSMRRFAHALLYRLPIQFFIRRVDKYAAYFIICSVFRYIVNCNKLTILHLVHLHGVHTRFVFHNEFLVLFCYNFEHLILICYILLSHNSPI